MPQTSFQPSFWDSQDPQETLMQENPILGRLAKVIPWEDFRPMLESIFDKEGKSPVGRKHTDVSIMFRLLVLQQYLNCSDMRLEYQVRNNLCLRYFVGLGVEDSVPDANTVWLFRKRIQQAGSQHSSSICSMTTSRAPLKMTFPPNTPEGRGRFLPFA